MYTEAQSKLQKIRNYPIKLFTGILCLTLAIVSAPAHAGIFTELSQLLSQNIDPVNDESIKMLSHLLGEQFVSQPTQQGLNSNTPATVLGVAFRHFNWFVFMVGMLWMCYVALASLLQTMHEGKVLGRRFSQAWLPVRIAFGAMSLLPVFKGFCFAQVLMMVCTLTGIAGANFITRSVLDASAGFTAIVQPALSSKKSLNTAKDIEEKILEASLCMKAASLNAQELKALDQTSAAKISQYDFSVQTVSTQAPFYIVEAKFAGPNGPKACGVLTIKVEPKFGVKLMNQTVTGVNVSAIAAKGINAHHTAIAQLSNIAMQIAQGAGDFEHGDAYNMSIGLLNAGYFGSYYKRVQEAFQADSSSEDAQARSAIELMLRNNITSKGWSTLGAYYGVFAETNDAINRMMEPTFTWEQPEAFGLGDNINATLYDNLMLTLNSAVLEGRNVAQAANQTVEDTQLGKQIVMNVFSDNNSVGTTGLFNPIMSFRALGHNIIGLSEALISKNGDETLQKSLTNIAANQTNRISVQDIANEQKQRLKPFTALFENLKSLTVSFGWAMLLMGMVMAFYLPLIPFILWFAALTRWIVSVFESMVGASLWALAHFDAEGEGMGRRASYGYTYALSNFAYPMLMVFGFLVASGLITVMGTFLFNMFGTAMATAQGNTLTSLSSIMAYLVIFTILGTTLITSIFNMCLYFQERVLAYIGSQGQSNTAGDFENKTNSMFMNAASQTSHIAQSHFNPNPMQPNPSMNNNRVNKLGHRQ